MSRSVNYSWQIERSARHQAYLARIQRNASRFHQRYQSLLNELVSEGLEQFLPKEFSNVRDNLVRLASLIETNPEAAKTLSFAIGSEISALPANARSVRKEFFSKQKIQEKEKVTLQQQSNNVLSQHFNSLLSQINDPVEQDFALEEINQLRRQSETDRVAPDHLKSYIEQINSKFASIRSSAKQAAEIWKQKKAKENSKESTNTLIEIHRKQAKSDDSCNPQMLASFLDQLEKLKTSSYSPESVEKNIAEATNSTDEKITDENCRKMVVRAILESLQKASFIVNSPKRVVSDKDEVVIYAKKPAGAQAMFKVAIDGSMIYKFDHYEGVQCKEDIKKVLPLLQEIYGVNLTDERVLWENPERISKSAKPTDNNTRGKRNV
jgi:hypothetical protein